MPTLITLGLLIWIWDFLWRNVGFYVIYAIRYGLWWVYRDTGSPLAQPGAVYRLLDDSNFSIRLLGVALSVLLIYVVGVFVGNLIGRTAWRLAEVAVMKIPLVSAIYPAVKQITDFLLIRADGPVPGQRGRGCRAAREGYLEHRAGDRPGPAVAGGGDGGGDDLGVRAEQPDGLQRVRAGRAPADRDRAAAEGRGGDAAAGQRRA